MIPIPEASTRPTAPGLPARHTVRKGETLWAIARHYYGTGARWKSIVAANPEVGDGTALRVGQVIRIPPPTN